MKRFHLYAQLLRLPNVFTAMADVGLALLSAWALAGIDLGERWLTCLLLVVSSSCLYCSGMVCNDYFDLEEDRKQRPFRPLASGLISPAAAVQLGVALMLAGLGCAVVADFGPDGFRPHSTFLALALTALILLYDGAFKQTWLAPFLMGACRGVNVLLGLSILAMAPPLWGWGLALTVGLYIVGVTWFARTEAEVSNPTQLVIGASIMLAALCLALTIPTLILKDVPEHRPAIAFPYLLVTFAFYLGLALVSAIQLPLPRLVQRAVKRSVLGLVLLDAVLATATAGWIGLALAGLLIPATILGKRVYST